MSDLINVCLGRWGHSPDPFVQLFISLRVFREDAGPSSCFLFSFFAAVVFFFLITIAHFFVTVVLKISVFSIFCVCPLLMFVSLQLSFQALLSQPYSIDLVRAQSTGGLKSTSNKQILGFRHWQCHHVRQCALYHWSSFAETIIAITHLAWITRI